MRIAMLCSDFYPKVGGMAVLNVRLSRALIRRGHQVTVIPLWWIKGCRLPEGISAVSPFFTIKKYPSRFGGLPLRTAVNEARYYAHGLVTSGRFRQYDIIHADVGAASLVGLHARRRFATPVAVGLGGHVFCEQKGRSVLARFVRNATKKILKTANAVIVDGTDIAEGLVAVGIPDDRLHVILNAIDFSEPAAAVSVPEAVSEGNRVMFWGRLVSENGPEDLVSAACHMPKVHVHIAGSGPMQGRLEHLIKRLGIGDRVHLLGRLPQDQLTQQIARCSVCAFPLTRIGGVSQVVAEAMAMGKAVVTTRVGSMSELVADRLTGVLIPPHQPLRMADAILELLRNHDLRNRIAAAGSDFVKEHWSWSRRVQEYEDVYNRLVELRSGAWNTRSAHSFSHHQSASEHSH